jgi:hypothetical protein
MKQGIFVEATINRSLARRGFKVRSTCPQHVPIVAGGKFTCSLVSATGQRGTVPVRITDASGTFAPGTGHVG